MNKKGILKIVENKYLWIRLGIFILSCFVVALNYNLFLVPNKLVIGGMSGLAIVINYLTGLTPAIFLNITTVILTIIAFIFLDKNKAIRSLFGAFCYTLMVSLTAPIAQKIVLNFNSNLMMILFAAILYGIFYGLIYRMGFNTGGSDTIIAIINKYFKISMGAAGNWTNIFIIAFGFFVFGPTKTIYAVLFLLLGNKVTDIVLLGIRDSKMCYIYSKNSEEIEEILLKERNIGVTEITSKGGIFTKRQVVLLVIIRIDDYYGFKHLIKNIDPSAFLLTTDCYAVTGGYKKSLIPF